MNYKKYKPSGVEWIGDIPEHWEVATVGRMCFLGRGRVINSIEIGENSGSYPVYSSQTENDGIMGYLNTYDFEGEYVTWTTDGANAGTVFYRNGKFNCTNVCGTIQPKNWEQIDLKFLPYFLNLGTRFSVRLDINPKLMNNMMAKIPLVLPPKYEQTAIANFLDEKTAKIDSLIEKKKKLIELYKEERTAVINHYVLGQHLLSIDNSQLTIDNYPLSINNYQLPKGWEVKKLKYVAKLEYGESLATDDRLDGEIPVYGSNGIVGYHSSAITKSPCIIIGRKGSFGKINWSDIPCFPIDTTYYIDQDRCKQDLRFIYFVLLTLNLDSISKDTGVPGLNRDDAYEKIIFLPPMKEQQQIVEYIDAETKRIDEKIKRTEKEIELLQEYRTALISEVVTGKIKV